MKRNLLKASLLCLTIAGAMSARAQVAISTTASNPTPDPAAVLSLEGNGSQGFILPTTTTASLAGMPKKKGMVVYNTTDGKVYYSDGTSWSPVGAGGGSGNLTTTTTGLTISGGTGAVSGAGTTVNIQNASNLQPGLLTAADWTTFNSKIGAATVAGGDLAGNYPSPTVTKIQGFNVISGLPATNSVLQFNGANWAPSLLAAGLTNPMTSPNDMIFGGAAGAMTRLPAPAANQVLTSSGASVPTWSSSLGLTGNINTTGNINGSNIVSSGSFSGNGNGITNLNAGNISGIVGFANGGTGASAFAANVVPRSTGTLFSTSNILSDGTNVGIGAAPALPNKLAVAGDFGTTGNINMTGLNTSIQFPSVAAPAAPMMYMFASGVSNADRFIIGHSPAFPNYGLEYQDSQDEFHFSFNGIRSMTFNPFGMFGVNQENPTNSLDVSGNAVIGTTYSGSAGAPVNGLLVEGHVGMGTTNPGAPLEVFDATNPAIRLRSNLNNVGTLEFYESGTTFGTDVLGFRIKYDGGTDNLLITSAVGATVTDHIVIDRGANRVGIQRNPSINSLEVEGSASKTVAGTWLANSDRRIKTDIQDITNGLDLIKKLRPVRFKYTNEWKAAHPTIEDKYYYNYIAQEYQKVFPDAVKGSGEFLKDDKNEILQIDTYDAQIVSIRAIQEQQAIIEKQQQQINTLTEELEKIKRIIGAEANAGKGKRK